MRTFNRVTFPDELVLKYPLGSGKTLGIKDWILLEPFRAFWTDDAGKEQTYTVEAGLVTDMSSIPWWAQGVPGLQKAGRNVRASIVHDDIYFRQGQPDGWTRLEADKLLYAGLRASGQGWLIASAMYRAVRLGGGEVWRT